jgi:CheY-like chemotaxis protein
VQTAPDAETALEIVNASKPRLIISDIRLPGMDGTDLANKLRTDPDLADIPIVLMSAYGDITARVADAFLGKPLDIEEVLETVSQFIQID